MAYKKRSTSSEQEKAQNRLDGIRQIETGFNYGGELSEVEYSNQIARVNDLTKEYNTLLIKADSVSTELDRAEKDLALLSTRLLNAVGAKYGYDSVEYEKAGGIRKSDYKHPAKKGSSKALSV